jgi:hypothetical protein
VAVVVVRVLELLVLAQQTLVTVAVEITVEAVLEPLVVQVLLLLDMQFKEYNGL